MTRIYFLTPEQEAQIPEYQQKWKNIYLSTQPIQRNRAKAAVQGAYAVMGKPEPEVIFCSSPRAAIEQLKTYISQQPQHNNPTQISFFEFASSVWENLWQDNQQQQLKLGIKPLEDLSKEVWSESFKSLDNHLENSLPKDFTMRDILEQMYFGTSPALDLSDLLDTPEPSQDAIEFNRTLEERLPDNWQEFLNSILYTLDEQLASLPVGFFFREWLKPIIQANLIAKVYGLEHSNYEDAIFVSLSTFEEQFLKENPPIVISKIAISCIWLDFAFSVLGYPHTSQKWSGLQGITKHCGWIFAVDNLCIICDRPTKILVNEDNQLHGEGETAIEFADGFVAYAYNGTYLPEKYGSVHPNQWQTQWIFEEEYNDLQEALIQGIGAVRLSQELPLIQEEIEQETMQEYTLFKIENKGVKKTYVLRRIDSQTGNIYAVFIPRMEDTIRRAIRYANRNYSAEQFPITDSGDVD